jgi:N-carbamoyl-L-amino-acid hydrolase
MDINETRLRSTLKEINQAAVNEFGGLDRVALSNEDKAGRDLLGEWMRELDLDVRVDDIGTMYGELKGTETAPPIVFGSHLDSVPNGGQYDGTLGVIAGLEVMRVLQEHAIRTRLPLVLVNFTNEEGARFEPAMMASGVIANQFTSAFVHTRQDRTGAIFKEELTRIGYLGQRENRLRKAHAYLELHVEQGPVLEDVNKPVGIVEGIQGITWLQVRLRGEADHAGPTPMALRRDGLVAAARVITEVRTLAKEYGDRAVATVGRIQANPGIINVIPEEVVLGLDIRHPELKVLKEMVAAAHRIATEAGGAESVDTVVEHLWTSPPVAFDRVLISTLETVAQEQGIQFSRMLSGAGHDAKYMAEITPTAMIFVRSRGGKSHSPKEKSDWEDIFQAVRLLLNTVLRLSE